MNFDLLGPSAARVPERPALWYDGSWHSYRELNARATRLANHLAAEGIGVGDRVGLLAANHIAHFDLLFAAAKIGFVFVPFDPRMPAAELRELANDVQPTLMFCDAGLSSTATQAFRCRSRTLEAYRDVVTQGNDPSPGAAPLSADSLQMILFTGGSTGRSKAVMIPYRQTQANAQSTVTAWSLSAEDCAIQATPCWHAAIHVLATPLLSIGGRVVLMSRFDAGEFLHAVERFEATRLFMVPSMYQAVVEHPAFASAPLGRVRWAISGGAPCPSAVARAFRERGVAFRQGYGMTEVGVNCFAIADDEARVHPESVGRPLPHVEVELRRPDGQPCAVDEVGELTFTGDALCAGYFNRGDEWNQVCREGWFWTGDLATRDAQGRYVIRGRRKDMYISGGENVYPAEVEAAIVECAGVDECAVLGVPDPRWGETGVAAVVMQPGQALQTESLRAALRTRLAAYKLPSAIVFVTQVPRTSAGKVDRVALRRLLQESPR